MAVDIAKTLFRTLAAEGVELPGGAFRTLQAQYVRTAEDMITRYHADAMINGLTFDSHAEEDAVDAFARGLRMAAEASADPLGQPLIPNWNRVLSAIPDVYTRLEEAVENDNA
jgi:glucosyl-3-phosphoglycerate synthase